MSPDSVKAKTIRDLAEACHRMKDFIQLHKANKWEEKSLYKSVSILLSMEEYEVEAVEQAKTMLRDFILFHNRNFREQTEMLEHLSIILVSPTVFQMQIRGEDL